jgi:glycosyltransferase involved in cell wall biosynthesis
MTGRRPRLLVVTPSADLYGSDRALVAALPALVRAFEVTVAFPNDRPAVAEAARAGAETVVLPDFALRTRLFHPAAILPWLRACASAVSRLTRLHRSRRFDVIYSNTINTGIGPVLRTLWRRPNVLHVHECPDSRPLVLRLVLGVGNRTSDAVLFASSALRNDVARHKPALGARGVVVRNGIASPVGRPPSIASRLRLTCPARIHPAKGHRVLVEAVGLASADGAAWDVHLYGDCLPQHISLQNELFDRITSLGLTEIFHWHGFVADTDALYRHADVCVVPSTHLESFSLVSLEAQARGVPVVATGGGPEEILEDGLTGFVVPGGDAPALAAAIRRLEDPALRERMGQAARERVIARFSQESFARAVVSTCQAVLAERCRRGPEITAVSEAERRRPR